MITKSIIDDLSYRIIGAAIEVHKTLGPGLLENIYKQCLFQELTILGIDVLKEQSVPLFYKGLEMDTNLRFDLLVEGLIVVELKTVDKLLPIFDAQLLTYMKLVKAPKGVLINFNVANLFYQGQKTLVNSYYDKLPR